MKKFIKLQKVINYIKEVDLPIYYKEVNNKYLRGEVCYRIGTDLKVSRYIFVDDRLEIDKDYSDGIKTLSYMNSYPEEFNVMSQEEFNNFINGVLY